MNDPWSRLYNLTHPSPLCAKSYSLTDPRGTAEPGSGHTVAHKVNFWAAQKFEVEQAHGGSETTDLGDFFSNHSQHLAKRSDQELEKRRVPSATGSVLLLGKTTSFVGRG